MPKNEKIITSKNLSPFLLCILSYLFLLRVSTYVQDGTSSYTHVYLGVIANTLPNEPRHQPPFFRTGCHTVQDGFQFAENDFNFRSS